jgi:hypothetical protein
MVAAIEGFGVRVSPDSKTGACSVVLAGVAADAGATTIL